MPTSIVARPIGPTYALSVTASQTIPISVIPTAGETMNYAEFINTATTTVCVVIAPPPKGLASPATPTITFPAAGAPTLPTTFMLGPSMQEPRVVPVPLNGFAVSAIASAAGPSVIFVTPVSVM